MEMETKHRFTSSFSDFITIFEGLEILDDKDFCAEWMNQWPVLFLTLKDVDALMTDPKAEPGNYWADTSHNNIIQRFIQHPCINVNDKFEIVKVYYY